MPDVTRTIAVSADDYHSNDGGIFTSSLDFITLNDASSTALNFWGAFRFATLSIPRNAKIDSAVLTLRLNEAPLAGSTIVAALEAGINPAASTIVSEMRARAVTIAKTNWPFTTANGLGNYTSPDFKASVQEQADKGDISAVIVTLRPSVVSAAFANNRLRFQSFDNTLSGAVKPQLTITWSEPSFTGSGSATAPGQTTTGTGTSDNPSTTGSGSAAAPDQTATGAGSSGNPSTTGSGSAAAPGQTATGAGQTESEPPYTAQGNAAAPEQTADGGGSSDNPAVTGDSTVLNPEPTVSGAGVTYLPAPQLDGPLTISPQSELANAVARHMLSLLPPGRKPREGGHAYFVVLALSALLADTNEAVIQMVLDWSPTHTRRGDLLALIGEARGIKRSRGEPLEAYRARVVGAADYWRLGGTVGGVKTALETAGYGVKITEHFTTDRIRWAEFSIELYPRDSGLTADTWDDNEGYWDDGTRWDWGISAAEGERIRDIIREMKAAHSKVRAVFYQHGGPLDYWDDDQGFWDDETLWHGFDPIQIL